MCSLTLLVVIVIALIIIEVILFNQHFETQDERDRNANRLVAAIVITILVGILLAYFTCHHKGDDQEYGLFRRKDKKVVPPVYVHEVNRKIYGNPMKKPTYNISSKYKEPVDASKIYGGAASAADINRNALNRRK